MQRPRRLAGTAVAALLLAGLCAGCGTGDGVQRGALVEVAGPSGVVAPSPYVAAPQTLDLPPDLPLPPAGARTPPTGRPATAAEARAYARAVHALAQRPFRVVQRDVLYTAVEVRDEDPVAQLVRRAVRQDDGRAVVAELDVQGRVLRAAGDPSAPPGEARPGELWLAQEYGAGSDSPTLSTLDPDLQCPGSCRLEVVGPGTYVLVTTSADGAPEVRTEVVLDGDRVVAWHTWYPEDVGNASSAAEYASLLLDLPADAAPTVPDPATVVSVAEQGARSAERDRLAQQPVRTCGEPSNGLVACAEAVPGLSYATPLLPQEPDGIAEAPPLYVPVPTG